MNKTGFGFLRLPHRDENDPKDLDYQLLRQLVDAFLARGGRYFDTAYTYLDGLSEQALRQTLVERYPRDAFLLADKLPTWQVKAQADCQDLFQTQLHRCGVRFFDYYLLHGLNRENWEICKAFDLFGFLSRLKDQGLARKIGFSFHDGPQLLDTLLTAHPEVDFVQLQINYLDWESPSIQARACYEVACRHQKPVIIMEPVKGGMLADLPPAARAQLKKAHPDWSDATWAMRFAQNLDHTAVVLSGMNTMAQVTDNLRPMPPLTSDEQSLLQQVAQLICAQTAIGCTGCNYCAPGCPQNIAICRYFALYNEYARRPADLWKCQAAYADLVRSFGKASACIGCATCEAACPQKLPIRKTLAQVAATLEES